MAKKSKVSGGLSPRWRSNIAKTSGVRAFVKEHASELKERAEAEMRARYPEAWDTQYGGYHYAMPKKSGMWGDTWIIAPISPMAKAHPEVLDMVASMYGDIDYKGEAS